MTLTAAAVSVLAFHFSPRLLQKVALNLAQSEKIAFHGWLFGAGLSSEICPDGKIQEGWSGTGGLAGLNALTQAAAAAGTSMVALSACAFFCSS